MTSNRTFVTYESARAALGVLSDGMARWFREAMGQPTPGQRAAWPALIRGQHLLLAAPTGSGKTLAAFVPILDALVRAPGAGLQCLYVTPLKALGNDIRKTLEACLWQMRGYFSEEVDLPTVALRTGDTTSRARRELRQNPASILLTTPESLAILLSQPWSEGLFAAVRWVIVDEVHALADNKRGADLALSLERLSLLARGLPQRIGLSATCAPLTIVAEFLTGVDRHCAIAHIPPAAGLQLRVEPLEEGSEFLKTLLARLIPEIEGQRTTLIFTNHRSTAERLTWLLQRRLPGIKEQIAVHHGSLDAAVRHDVERRLKLGILRCVVSTSSLEMGIDIGTVDGVVLVHAPGSVVRLLQRVGRAGHGPGRLRRGLILTATAGQLLEAAVTSVAGLDGQCEPVRLPQWPLDVLCQQLAGMASQRAWGRDEALACVRRATPYRNLEEADFQGCIDYLSGRKADGTAWLPARLSWAGTNFAIADASTARLVRRNLGTILSEPDRAVRLRSGQVLGKVEEAFVDRLRPGDRFILDGRTLEFRRIVEQEVLVDEAGGYPVVPRWTSATPPLARELAQRLYVLRQQAAEALRSGPDHLRRFLGRELGLCRPTAEILAGYFARQEALSEIPDTTMLLVEHVAGDFEDSYHFHTPLNRAGNDALARVACLRLTRDHGRWVESVTADLGFCLRLRGELTKDLAQDLLSADRFRPDLDEAIAASETLRGRFQRVAATGLMLLRQPNGARRRVGGSDWAGRRLLDQVRAAEPDFVLVRQAMREVREEACDLDAALAFLTRLPNLAWRCRRLAHISPFAAGWTQLVEGPVGLPANPADVLQRLHAELMKNAQAG